MPSDDPLEDAEVGETRTLSHTSEMDAYEMAWDEFVGFDREVDHIRVEAVDGEITGPSFERALQDVRDD